MSEELNRTDDIFKSAYQQFEEIPSPQTWEKINTSLDKKAIESYKRKLTAWKRAVILLLLILSGYMLYESGIMNNNPGKPYTNQPANAASKDQSPKKENNQQKTHSNPDKFGEQNIQQEKFQNNNDLTIHFEKETGLANIGADHPEDNPKENKTPEYNSYWKENLIPGSGSGAAANGNERIDSKFRRNHEIARVNLSIIKFSVGELLPNTIQPVLQDARKIQLLNKGFSNNKKQKTTNRSVTNSTINFYTAYDWLKYRLDNDLPASGGIRQREVQEPSYSAGVLLSRSVYKRWEVQSGIIFSLTAIGIAPQKIYAEMETSGTTAYKYITSSGYAYIKPSFSNSPAIGDSLLTEEAKHRVHYVSVPLIMRYTVSAGKFSLSPGGGIVANFTTAAKLETEIEDALNRETVTVTHLKGTKKFHWALMADATVQFEVNKKVSLQVRPSFRYAISPISKNNELETFPYSFSAGAGLSYKF